MPHRKRALLLFVYVMATIQMAWCYLWLTRPYVNTLQYELGSERMPFQGRCLMMLPMRLAGSSIVLHWLSQAFKMSRFWFPRPVQPEVLMQAIINVLCLIVAGIMTTEIYKASSRRRLLTPFVYPLLLVVCMATYVMHTVQNFRFIYDLPSLAFFSVAMYLLYFRKHWAWFAALFMVATINRETTLLLLPLYLIDATVVDGQVKWRRVLHWQKLGLVGSLAAFWITWQGFIRFWYYGNRSEFYPRLDWNVKSLLVPQAWPQLLSACGYLLLFVVVMRNSIPDKRLKAWLWLLPIWVTFMFTYGILVETRVFGELIPFVVCATALISEELLLQQMRHWVSPPERRISRRALPASVGAWRESAQPMTAAARTAAPAMRHTARVAEEEALR